MSKFFVERPIVAIVISVLTVLLGVVALVQLPVSLYPNIAPPEVLVQATYVGADALTIEQAVATPIEAQMTGVDNMLYMMSTSTTSGGQMGLRVAFDVTTDPSTDQVLAQMRYSQAAAQLPPPVTTQGDTVNAIQAQNTANASGQVGGNPAPPGQQFTYTVRAPGRLDTPAAFGDIVVRARPDGSVVRVKDVARVELGAQTYNTQGR